MKIIDKKEFLQNKEFYLEEMKRGKTFVYPTDTIYGIGCDALNDDAIAVIREIKMRDEKPFSVIAPGKEWILNNCIVNENVRKWIDKLPGPYTLILRLKNWEAVSDKVNHGMDSIGVRISSNWFSKIVEEFGKPFVTTSVNLTGEPFMVKIDDLKDEIKKRVDYIVYEGVLRGKPSKIVKLINGKEKIIER